MLWPLVIYSDVAATARCGSAAAWCIASIAGAGRLAGFAAATMWRPRCSRCCGWMGWRWVAGWPWRLAARADWSGSCGWARLALPAAGTLAVIAALLHLRLLGLPHAAGPWPAARCSY